jgi:hypothetical protein
MRNVEVGESADSDQTGGRRLSSRQVDIPAQRHLSFMVLQISIVDKLRMHSTVVGSICEDDPAEREECADDDSPERAGDHLNKSKEVGEHAYFRFPTERSGAAIRRSLQRMGCF